ncbi:MAG: hypothetical protein IT287_08680 [Bdellovibrionaceae bacterium]|nr:hypothetical protein [Pseudobdellovibrionaceae bacterium]
MVKNLFYSLYADESAQGATEYILMLIVVVGIAMMFKDKIMSILENKTTDLDKSLRDFSPQ